jgi:galactitol-specific phosphotransferase system IIB component
MTPSQKIRDFFIPERLIKYDLISIESLAGVKSGVIVLILREELHDSLTDDFANNLLVVTNNILKDEKTSDKLVVLKFVTKK